MKKLYYIFLLALVILPTSAFAAIAWDASADSSNRDAAKDSLTILSNKDFWFNLMLWFVALIVTIIAAKFAKTKITTMMEEKLWEWESWDVAWVIMRTVNLFIYFFWISVSLTLWWLDLSFLIWGIWIWLWFTMQTFLSNFIWWIIMIFWWEYKTWTVVEISNKMWSIVKISSLFTSIKQFNWVIVYVPNVKFLQEEVQCFNVNPSRRLEIEVWVDNSEDIIKAKKIINKVIESFPNILKAPQPFIMIDELWDYGISIRVFVWFSTWEDIFVLKSNLTETINMAFAQAGVKRRDRKSVV